MASTSTLKETNAISTSVHGFKYFVGSDSTAERFIKFSTDKIKSDCDADAESTERLRTGTDD